MFTVDFKSKIINQYDLRRFIPYCDDMYDILDSTFLYKLNNINRFGIYTVTVEENKPSLLSEKIYGAGNTQYWWILLYFNNILDCNSIPAGTQLRYPALENLENIYFGMNTKRLK